MNAQKLIVIKGDAAVVPTLKNIVSNSNNPLQKVHALRALEGLNSIEENILLEKLQDEDPRVRRTAIRISEIYLKENNETILAAVDAIKKDEDKKVLLKFYFL